MKQIHLLDGGVGTSLWELADAAGIKRDPVWKYNMEHPELVRELLKRNYDAGARLILTNTFGANGPAVKRSSDYPVTEVVKTAVRLWKETLGGTDAKMMLAAGPMSMLMEPYGDLTEEEVYDTFTEMLGAGIEEGGVDLICLQTFLDVEMMRVAATAAKQFSVPVVCMMTFAGKGKTMMGNSVDDIIETLEPLGIDGIGLNCSLGPEQAMPVLKEFAEKTKLPVWFKPNAGLPMSNAGKEYPYDDKRFAEDMAEALPYADYIGGCCGCNDTFIRALKGCIDKSSEVTL